MEKYPYSIVVDHHTYSVDSKKANSFFVVHVTPHQANDKEVETGTFDWSPETKSWTIIGENKLDQKHTPDILSVIVSKFKH